jgi:hypothetical protein
MHLLIPTLKSYWNIYFPIKAHFTLLLLVRTELLKTHGAHYTFVISWLGTFGAKLYFATTSCGTSGAHKIWSGTLYNILLYHVAHPAHARFWSRLKLPLCWGHLYNLFQVCYHSKAEHQIVSGLDYFKDGALISQSPPLILPRSVINIDTNR